MEQERWPKGNREPLSSEECGTQTKMKMQQNKWSQADGEIEWGSGCQSSMGYAQSQVC